MNHLLRSTRNRITTNILPFKPSPATTSVSTTKTNNQRRQAHNVRVIVTKDIPENNQYAGETHDVKAGYARNYLLPKKLALYATTDNFRRVGIVDPETLQQKEEVREEDVDENVKAAEFLKYYLRNKTLKIWRNVDMTNVTGVSVGERTAISIYPGKVTHENVREKLSNQLKIDLDNNEKVQIHPEPISFSLLEEDETMMDDLLKKMEPLSSDDDGKEGQCKVELKALGEYLVKIHLKGNQAVGLRLNVARR